MENKKIICWWSGGVTSAVACKKAIELYGVDRCRAIMIDTRNEHEDTYRFKADCERWYGIPIERIGAFNIQEEGYTFIDIGRDYKNIQDVWIKNKSLNVATGAICSTELKRRVREKWQEKNVFKSQVFGYEFTKREMNRALSLKLNHPKTEPIFPLLMLAIDKPQSIEVVFAAGIEPPSVYESGYLNNNCAKTGCVQGGIGYWQKIRRDDHEKFDAMAEMEHYLTRLRGEPVTMLKDQSKEAIEVVKQTGIKWKQLVFLKKHPEYPELKCLADMKDQEVKPLFECNGFCNTNDLNPRNETEKEINYETSTKDI